MHLSMLSRRRGGRAWGGDLIVFVNPGVGHLTDHVLPGEGIFESFFAPRGDIWLPTRKKETETKHMFPASTLHACAVQSGKSGKSWRPLTRASERWVDFTVLSSNFVCFSVFLFSWTLKDTGVPKETEVKRNQVDFCKYNWSVFGSFATITVNLIRCSCSLQSIKAVKVWNAERTVKKFVFDVQSFENLLKKGALDIV